MLDNHKSKALSRAYCMPSIILIALHLLVCQSLKHPIQDGLHNLQDAMHYDNTGTLVKLQDKSLFLSSMIFLSQFIKRYLQGEGRSLLMLGRFPSLTLSTHTTGWPVFPPAPCPVEGGKWRRREAEEAGEGAAQNPSREVGRQQQMGS